VTDTPVARLRGLVAEHRGDLAAAVAALAGATSVTALAERLMLPRQTVQQALAHAENRTYAHVYRALEAELQLPPYALDAIRGGR
jgi:hypothetical protein